MNAAIDLPDALAFGKFKMDAPPSYLCSDLAYAHDPGFGAFMLGNTLAADDNTTAVAWGFLAHTLGDMIGFWLVYCAQSTSGRAVATSSTSTCGI
jgi:hypothetical protein